MTAEIRQWKVEDELTREERRERYRAQRGGRPVPVFATDEWRSRIDAQVAEVASRREEATRKLREAERELGVAVIERTSAPGARKRIEDARSELLALTAAEAEIREREERDAARHSEAEHRARCADAYRWIASYMARAEVVLRARETLMAAEDAMWSIGRNALLVNRGLGGVLPGEAGLDEQLLVHARGPGKTDTMRVGKRAYKDFVDISAALTPALCIELREKAERLALAEETGAA